MQSDGAYVTYTPEGGADTVTKKLGDTGYQLIGTVTDIEANVSASGGPGWGEKVKCTIPGYTSASQFLVAATKIRTHLHGTVTTGKEYNATLVPKVESYNSETGVLTISGGTYFNVGGDADYKYRYYTWVSEIAIYAVA